MSCNVPPFDSSYRPRYPTKVGERPMPHIKLETYQEAEMARAAQTRRRLIHGHLYPPRATAPFAFNGRHYNGPQHSTMLSSPTFFDDTFYPNENIADDGSAAHHQLSGFSFRPLTPLGHAAQTSPRVTVKVESPFLRPIPAPGILTEPVDTSEYSAVGEEELAQAEVDYDVPSPASLDSYTTGSYTTLTDAGSVLSDGYSRSQRDHPGFGAHRYNEFQFYISRHGHPMHGSSHDLQSMALKQNHLAIWNGQSCSAPASLPAGHLTFHPSARVSSSMSEHQSVQASAHFVIPNQVPPPLARPFEISSMLPTNEFSQSFSSASTDFSHGFSIHELDTSDTNIDSDSDEEDRKDEGVRPLAAAQSDGSEIASLQGRQGRDAFLLKLRNQGISYKTIKDRGGFQEAESTLRGRVRMLTKEKSARVRKPVWTSKDVSLLHRGVGAYSGHHSVVKIRNAHGIPWKKVSEYITDNGGTYKFAPATCAKKWDGIIRRQ